VFIDTAGLREAGDAIEVEGIRRSRETLARAELILHVVDASEPLTREDEKFLKEFAGKKRIVVRNKTDLVRTVGQPLTPSDGERVDGRGNTGLESPVHRQAGKPALHSGSECSDLSVDISCTTGEGIEALKDAIKGLVWAGQINAEMLEVMINSRHQDALNRARAATLRSIDAIRADASLELVALDLHIAANAVGEIVGKTTTEDLLDSIFSQFCIGK